jgi:hypothetical protein
MAERIVVSSTVKPWLGGNIKGGDSMTYFPEIWDFIIDHFEPKSICDVGCGEGHLIKYFHDRFFEVHGIDGMQENKDNAHPDVRDKIIVHDYTTGHGEIITSDMIISCEFVEHVDPKYTKNYLLQFYFCNTLIFTHAVPGQGGYHHVNCHDDDYWIEMIKALGFEFLLPLTIEARDMAIKYDKVLWQSILIFKRNGR